MTRQEIIFELKNYFTLSDLVCPHAYANHGERAWQFLDTELLETILVVRRDILKVGMIVNTARLTQRGLRCNICQLVKDKTAQNISYLSAHVNGAAIDFDALDMTAQQVRARIIENSDLLPYPIRLEADVSWVHVDIYDTGNDQTITIFKG